MNNKNPESKKTMREWRYDFSIFDLGSFKRVNDTYEHVIIENFLKKP